MRYGRRFSAALALKLTLFASACAPQNPPAIPTLPAQTLTIPLPLPPKDASLFAYLKIRDLKQTIDLFGGLSSLGPLAARGINLSEVQVGKPAALYVWDPGGASSPATVPAVALLPVPADGSLVSGLKATAATVHIEPSGDGTMAAMNDGAADRAKEQLPALQEILTAPLPFEGLAYFNAVTILDKYLPVLRQGVRSIEPMLALAAAQRKDAPSPRTTMGMMEQILNTLETVRAVAIGVKPYDGGIELSTMVQDRKPSAGGPVPAADLAAFLPPADVRVVWNTRDIKHAIDFYMGMYGPMLDEKPGLRAQVQGIIDDWQKVSHKVESAASFEIGGDKGFHGYGLMRVDNPAAMLAVVRKTIQLFNQGAVHDIYKGMGVDLQIAQKPKARKLKGWPVDFYEYHVALSPEVTPQSARAVWEKLGHTTYEVAQIGPYIVYGMNASIDPVVISLFTGKGANPMQATKVFSPGGGIYLDMNVPGVIAGLKAMLPPNLAEKLPNLPPQPDLVTLFGYDSGEIGYYKLRLPGLLLAALRGGNH